MARRPAIIIDGANVAYEGQPADSKPKVSSIVAVKQLVEELGFRAVIIVDASLRHAVDDPDQLEGLFRQGKVLQAPSGTAADYFVLRTADELEAQVISNDEFEPYRREFPWIKKRRVPYMVIGGRVELYRPKLKLPDDSTETVETSRQARGKARSQAGDATAVVSES